MSNCARCAECQFAKWELTPKKRIKQKVAGRCEAPRPPLPKVLSLEYVPPTRLGIWPDFEGVCDLFKPIQGSSNE